jgi:5-hydroxyisourate hydrolase
MSPITTHILDTSQGRPARGVAVRLERLGDGREPRLIGQGATDGDGRLRDLLPAGAPLEEGVYRLVFETGAYFREQGVEAFYPEVAVVFQVGDAGQHYHVPLLLNPFGYSTYRGS